MADLLKDSSGAYFAKSLMDHILLKNNAEILSILHEVTDPGQLSSCAGNTLLHYAAFFGNTELVQHLIDLGAPVDARNYRHETPLFVVVDSGERGAASLLVEANADLFMPDDRGQCPLAKAIEGRPHVKTALLDKLTVDCLEKNVEYVKSQDFQRYCGLHNFIPLKNADITRFLLESGSPVNAKSPPDDDTALHLAARQDPRSGSCSWEIEGFEKMLDLLKKQVASMKQIMIEESLSIFDFFIASDEEISLLARNRRSIITSLTNKLEEHDFDSYYNRRLQTRYLKFSRLAETRESSTILIEQVFNELCNTSVYMVAKKIVNYLDDQELYKI